MQFIQSARVSSVMCYLWLIISIGDGWNVPEQDYLQGTRQKRGKFEQNDSGVAIRDKEQPYKVL